MLDKYETTQTKTVEQERQDDAYKKTLEEMFKDDWRAVMKTKEGKRILSFIIWDISHVDSQSIALDPYQTAFNEGARSVGVALINLLKNLDINQFSSMMVARHNAERNVERREQSTVTGDSNG